MRLVLTPYLLLFFRTRAIDSDKVPADGPVIVAPNHFSFLDHFFVAVYLRRKVQFMAKSQLFKGPMIPVYYNGGVFPVRRGHRDTRRSRPPTPCSPAAASWSCTARAAARAPASSASPSPASGGWRWSRARRSCPWRWWAPSACATGSGCSSRRSPCSSATRSASTQVEDPSREQSQAASEQIFARIRGLWQGLRENGRSATVKAARAARRAAEAAGRRPASS